MEYILADLVQDKSDDTVSGETDIACFRLPESKTELKVIVETWVGSFSWG